MTRKSAQSASPEGFRGFSTPDASRTPPFGFQVPQQNAIVHAGSWSSGESRIKSNISSLLHECAYQRSDFSVDGFGFAQP